MMMAPQVLVAPHSLRTFASMSCEAADTASPPAGVTPVELAQMRAGLDAALMRIDDAAADGSPKAFKAAVGSAVAALKSSGAKHVAVAAAMKAEGIEYDERMELLEAITYPRPLDDLLAAAFDTFRRAQPWIADFELRPKSVVRDMYERAMSFGEYVAFYKIARSEGVVLRYLSDAFRAVSQTIPEELKSDDLRDLIAWLGEVVRQIDSSLLDEWEELVAGAVPAHSADEPVVPPAPRRLTANVRAFRVLVRNELFRRVQLAARRDVVSLAALDPELGEVGWAAALDAYFAEHDRIDTGADARGPGLLAISEGQGSWTVRQILDDPEGDHDWGISATVDLLASDETGEARLVVTAMDRL